MTNVEGRVIRLETLVAALRAAMAKIGVRTDTLESQIRQISGQSGGGGGGASQASYWCISPGGGIAAATGVWPTLTPTSFTADVYRGAGATVTAVVSGATCIWRYKDTDPGNRLVPLQPNPDGSFDCLVDSCTRVDV